MTIAETPVVPRTGLDFGLTAPIPRHWFDDDPFKTRLLDATSTVFPPGERFFMAAVRRYANDITDARLKRDVDAFMVQEGQHGRLHALLNEHLRTQGIDVDGMEATIDRLLKRVLRTAPRRVTIAQTSALEHLTAVLAQQVVSRPELLRGAARAPRALYLWHAVEELEHKAVAFDVMKQSGEVPYLLRCMTLLVSTMFFQLRVYFRVESMLRVDGFGPLQRVRIMFNGMKWLLGRGGLYRAMLPAWLRYFRPDFHPHDEPLPVAVHTWLAAYDSSSDPLHAAAALH